MKKLINTIYPLILIIGGSALEIYYYFFRFDNDGINIYISLLIAFTLTVLLTYAASFIKNKKYLWLIIPLAIFSVITTSSGQSFSVGIIEQEKQTNQIQQLNNQEKIIEYKHEIELLENEYIKLSASNTASTTWARREYGTEINEVEKRLDEIKAEKSNYQTKIDDLRNIQTIRQDIKTEDKTNIYKFYGSLFGINEKWLQFILQTILSVFIALSAPLGFYVLNNKKQLTPEEEPEQKIKCIDPYIPYLEKWVTISWFRKTKHNINKLYNKEWFYKYMDKLQEANKNYERFPEDLYDLFYSIALKIKLVDKEDNICIIDITEREAVELIKENI